VIHTPRTRSGIHARCRPERKAANRRTPRESWFKGERPCSQTGDLGATRKQRAFFSFPPPQQRPASGPNAVRRVGHLNAVHKGALLRHRNLGNEQRTIVLVSGVSFSCKYSAIIPFRKSVPFGTVTSSPERQLMRTWRDAELVRKTKGWPRFPEEPPQAQSYSATL